MPPLCKGRCPSAHTGAEGLGGRRFDYLKANANSYNGIVPFRIGLFHIFDAYCPIPPTHELWYDCPRQSWRFLIRCAEHHISGPRAAWRRLASETRLRALPLHKGGMRSETGTRFHLTHQ